jgi:SAM-dependent methyltransferase
MDASWPQAEAARERGLIAIVMNGHQLGFKRCLDAVFTNAALHWMKQPENVVAGVCSSLKPDGRFVGEFGGKGNVETIRSALHAGLRRRGVDPWSIDPWYYPSAEEYSQLLAAAGFTVAAIELISRPTPLPGDITGWLEVFAQPFSRSVPESERKSFIDEVRSDLEPRLRGPGGNWIADYVRLRFSAVN